MIAPSCSLDAAEQAAQLERYRRLGQYAAKVEHGRSRVVVHFFDDPPNELLERTLDIERGCCPFFEIEYEPQDRRLQIAVDHPDRQPGLDAIARALGSKSRATGVFPDSATRDLPTVPVVTSCCSATALVTCCQPDDKRECCGDPTVSAPSSCGCRA
jgi:hypothetical protein